jgi:SOS response regulatory protein OraA/RecX
MPGILETQIIPRRSGKQAHNQFTDRKYIDDERFAQLLIYSLIERGKSKSHIIQKLKENELPASVWETILASSFDPFKTQKISMNRY